MQDKYHLTLEQNLYLAKRNLIDSIWKSAKIEGINVTFPQTYAIVEKAAVQNVSVEDILKITNLKHAWQILIQEPEAPLTLEWLCKVHGEVAKDEALEWENCEPEKLVLEERTMCRQFPTQMLFVLFAANGASSFTYGTSS